MDETDVPSGNSALLTSVDHAIRLTLAKISREVASVAGQGSVRLAEADPDQIDPIYAALSIEQKTDVARETLAEIFKIFVQVTDIETFNNLISIRGESLISSKDSVISWLEILDLLLNNKEDDVLPSYRPADLIASINSYEPELMMNALWAPHRVSSASRPKEFAYDELLAISMHDQLIRRGFDVNLIRDKLTRYYGVSWDTMRKWKRYWTERLKKEDAERVISDGASMTEFIDWPIIESFIFVAGTSYRRRRAHPTTNLYENVDELRAYLRGGGADPSDASPVPDD